MRFIRKNGHIIPINDKVKQVVKGAVKDAVNTGVGTALLNHIILKAPPKISIRAGVVFGAAWGGLSAIVRTTKALSSSKKKRAA